MRPIYFELNIPAELTIDNSPNRFVLVATKKLYNNNVVFIDFIDLDTNLVTHITDWLSVWELAHKVAEEHWQARSNAKPISDMEVKENGEIIYKEITTKI